MTENRRTGNAREHDDSELLENVDRAPSHAGSGGGNIARDVGAEDEEKRATGEAGGLTRVSKSHKVQPPTGTRSDHEAASGKGLADR